MESLPGIAPSRHLPRLPAAAYQERAVVFWTHTVEHRRTGWLDDFFHVRFRESMLHAAVRENLLCPIYTLMPDHIHLIWMGVSKDSDQRRATQFLRRELSRWIEPHGWQHQAHDRMLRREERRKRAFAAACAYIEAIPSAHDWWPIRLIGPSPVAWCRDIPTCIR